MVLKEQLTYYFSVEGETENWYLKWLEKEINRQPSVTYRVKLDSKVQKDPLSRAKSMSIMQETDIYHIMDMESLEPIHTQRFQTALDRMAQAQDIGKSITCHLGYSNFTFELWIILHMADCNGSLTHRRQYLEPLNRAYGEQFENLDQYKHEANFKRILKKLTLDHVKQAVRRSKVIMRRNEENGYTLQRYKGYQYYEENPSLSIGEVIERILKDCELL